MQRTLSGWLPESNAPHDFHWEAWQESLIDKHASVKYLSFAGTIDAELFPNLACLSGCRMLMRWIRDCEGFCPQATWLLANCSGAVGAIQCIMDQDFCGSIQNIGVLPSHRRHGFGALLIAKALQGFRSVGAVSVTLEVTASNPNALRLYRRLGFRPYNSYLRHVDLVAACAKV